MHANLNRFERSLLHCHFTVYAVYFTQCHCYCACDYCAVDCSI